MMRINIRDIFYWFLFFNSFLIKRVTIPPNMKLSPMKKAVSERLTSFLRNPIVRDASPKNKTKYPEVAAADVALI